MEYDVDAQIGGKLAMLGSRLIDTTARSLADQFFSKFAAVMRQAHSSALATKTKRAKKTKAAPARKKLAAKKPAKPRAAATKTKKKAIKSRSR
jgi:hypothetical protein